MPFVSLRWRGWKRFTRDMIFIQIGFALFGIAINMLVNADLGMDSWDVLQVALTHHFPITLGESSIIVAALVVLADVALKEPLGWGSVANMVCIGIWIDLLKPYVPTISAELLIQMAYLLIAVLIMGFATAIYIGVDAGAGPRDTLMLAFSRRGNISVRLARAVIEVTVVAIGWLLGGPAWLGTLVAAVLIGPTVQFAFKLLRVKGSLHPEAASLTPELN